MRNSKIKQTDLYLLLSGCTFVITFLTGLGGGILSGVLLYLIHTEKKKLKKKRSAIVNFKTENRKLTIAQILCAIDILIVIIGFLGVLVYIGLAFFRGH